ncbi:MAG: hypothetical protein JO362_22015 [Streptomycetaceae bacterium]|nr:hypothetical protein [Streptomycetaceae bacterium]
MTEFPQSFRVTLNDVDEERPLNSEMVVTALERREEADYFGGRRVGLYAAFKMALRAGGQPTSFGLSRLEGEPHWVIDDKFGANGFPHFCHGFGSRVTIPRTVREEIAEVLDNLARSSGLAAEIGADIPLILA